MKIQNYSDHKAIIVVREPRTMACGQNKNPSYLLVYCQAMMKRLPRSQLHFIKRIASLRQAPFDRLPSTSSLRQAQGVITLSNDVNRAIIIVVRETRIMAWIVYMFHICFYGIILF